MSINPSKVDSVSVAMMGAFFKIIDEIGVRPTPENWSLIALAIAIKYAPEMQVQKKRGRNPSKSEKQTSIEDWELAYKKEIRKLIEVATIFHENGNNVTEAVAKSSLSHRTYQDLARKHSEIWKAMKKHELCIEMCSKLISVDMADIM